MVKSIKKLLSFTLAICLALIMFATMPRTAAAGIGAPADLTAGANLSGMRVYFGSYTGGASTGPIRWYVVATDAGTATLWTTTNMANSQYSNTTTHESWSGSPLCTWLNGPFFSSAFSAAERAAAMDYGSTEQANLDTVNTDLIQINQKIILPSVMEMNGTDGTGYGMGAWDIDYDTRASLNRWWWLRSPGEYDYRAAIVAANGEVMMHGSSVDSNYAVHPAFRLDLSSVFFTSDASGANAKSSAAVGNGLMAATATSGPVKLTIQSASQTLTIASAPTTQTASTGGTLTYAYAGATTGTNQYISCVLEQSSAVKYYGKLADCSSAAAASGTVSIPLAGVPAGSYTLKVFSEEANGDNLTDYAGAKDYNVTVHVLPTPVSASASVSNVTISGTAGSALGGGQRATITLTGETVAANLANADASGWFTGLPAGITVTASASAGGGTITLTFGGTPTAASTAQFNITIPGNVLTGGSPIAVAANPNARFSISGTPQPPSPLPKTGDGFPMGMLLALLGVGLIAMAYTGARLRKQRKRE